MSTVCLADAQAAGLGTVHVHSALGQPLVVGIPVLGLQSATLEAHCVKARVESLDGAVIAMPRVQVLGGSEQPSLLIRTGKSVNEPVVTVSVALGCEMPVRREYQIFLDPPFMRPEEPLLANVPALEVRADQPAQKSPGAGPAASAPAKSSARRMSAETKAAFAAKRESSLRAGNRRPAQSVLRLSTVDLPPESEMAPLRLQLSGMLTLPADDTSPAKLGELRRMQKRLAATLNDKDYLQVTESKFDGLESEAQAMRREMARLRKDNESAKAMFEDSRDTLMRWVQGLGAALAASLAALAVLAWMRRGGAAVPSRASKESGGEGWKARLGKMTKRKEKPVSLIGLDDDAMHDGFLAHAEPHPEHAVPEKAAGPSGTPASPAPDLSFDDRLSPASSDQVAKAEEISDLLELAEAWLVLNQPQAVIEILKPMNTEEPPKSPLPWIYLMHAYRLAGEQANYEDLARRIRKTFNLDVPEWNARPTPENGPVKTLADFPHIRERIARLWSTNEIIPYLKSLLIDDREGKRMGLPLQVYQDILRLIRIAKDPERERLPYDKLPEDFPVTLLRETAALDSNQFAFQMASTEDEPKVEDDPGLDWELDTAHTGQTVS